MNDVRIPVTASPRDLAGVVFRHRWAVVICYVAIVATTGLYCFFWPPTYEAHVRYLVKNNRLDPVLTAEQQGLRTVSRAAVTEADLNSESEIMKSRAVIESTVRELDLEHARAHWAVQLLRAPLQFASHAYNAYHGRPDETALANTVGRLATALTVEPQRESNVILVTLRWGHPQAAEQILTKHAELYLQQHLAVRRTPDAAGFFAVQLARTKSELARIDASINAIRPGATSNELEADRALAAQQASQFESERRKSTVLEAESTARIASIESQLKVLPENLVLQDKSVVSAQALEALKMRVLDLRLQRTALLQRYEDGHRLVQEVQQRLTEAEQMLNDEERRSYSERTTGRNQTADVLDQDLRLARAQLTGFKARGQESVAQERAFRMQAADLETAASRLRELERDRATVQHSLDEYARQLEEARVNDEMKFVNVAVIESVTSSAGPVKPNVGLLMKLALGLGLFVSLALAFGLDFVDHRVRTDRELETTAGVPVLAVFDRYREPREGGRRG